MSALSRRALLLSGAAAAACTPDARAQRGEIEVTLSERIEPLAQALAPPLFGVNIHAFEDEDALDHARDAGFAFVRADARWEEIEAEGRFDLSAVHALLDRLDARGLKAHFVLAYGHPDHGGERFADPANLAAFARYSEAVARACRGQGACFEIWNEPDVEEKAYLAPQTFAALLAAGARGVRAGDPDARIVSGGLSWVDFDYLDATLSALAAAPVSLDAFGMHFYRRDIPETVVSDIAAVAARVAPAFGAIPIWNTEWGYSSVDPPGRRGSGHAPVQRRRQAALLARQQIALWRAGVARSVWFELEDFENRPRASEMNMGLLDADNRPKPALAAAAHFMARARGRMLTAVQAGLPEAVLGVRLSGAEDEVLALWSAQRGARGRLIVPAETYAGATDMLGRPIAAQARAGAPTIPFAEADGPIYVTLKSG